MNNDNSTDEAWATADRFKEARVGWSKYHGAFVIIKDAFVSREDNRVIVIAKHGDDVYLFDHYEITIGMNLGYPYNIC